jgi:apolipoprotein D and lipocalin family protein
MKMIKATLMIAVMMMATAAVWAQGQTSELKTVGRVDLKRYAGTWYEIAKYPNKFQKQCVGNTTAEYTLLPNGRVEVVNECVKRDGMTDRAKGSAKIADKATNAKLKVRFAPGFLSVFPFVWGDYWVIDLDPEYQYSVVGDPKREYFWILSRTKEMDDATYQNILRRAEAQGFNPGKVEKTPQNMEVLPGGVIERQ